MRKFLLLKILCLVIAWGQVRAQEQAVTGKVTAVEDGAGLPGVNVVVKGTAMGTVTDVEGNFRITVPSGSSTLVFSFIGYVTKEIAVDGKSIIDVELGQDVQQLNEVVVTAIGLEREKKALGYSLQHVSGEQVSQKATNNVFESLQGKVAGLSINQNSGAPGAGSTILIRGVTSLSGSNRNGPLIIVDGTPIDNSVFGTDAAAGSAEVFGSAAMGNRGVDLNPEDVASVSVLKGPRAAALYGIRAANGAIVITTKRGAGANKFSGVVTSSYTLSKVNILPKFQNEFGQGLSFRHHSAVSGNSWGRRFGAIPNDSIVDHNGKKVPYQAYPDNVKDFFDLGHLFTNNIQLSGGSTTTKFILSLGRTDQAGIIPGSEMERTNIRLAGNTAFENGISLDGSFNYINTNIVGSPQGNSGSSVFFVLPVMPRSYDLLGRPTTKPDGTQDFYSTSSDNPLWSATHNPYTSKTNRFIGSGSLSYQFTEWLSATYKAGFDIYNESRKEVYGVNSRRFLAGQVTDDIFNYRSIESNFLINIDKEFGDRISLKATLGHNINDARRDRSIVRGSGLLTPTIYNVLNTQTVTVDPRNGVDFNRRLIGVFGEATVGYNDYLFLSVSGRNDWSSTLPVDNRSFFYPSAALSFLFTDAFNISSNILSAGKLRVNWAQVGNDADPFLTRTVYVIPNYGNNVANVNFPFGSTGGFTQSGVLGNNKLKPERTTGYEYGAELGFFKSRFTVDFTYYDQRSEDQIITLQVPSSTGFNSYVTNAGLITNKGIEVLLSGNVLKVGDFKWDASINFSRNRSMVVKLAEGLKQTQLAGFTGTGSFAVEGQPFGVFITPKFARDPQTGELLVINSGVNRGTLLPGATDEVVGNPNPDWNGSLINNLSYKGFRLGFQLDMQKGGDIISNTIAFGTVLGSLEETAVDRDQPRIIKGVQATPTGAVVLDDQGHSIPNNIQVTAETYWRAFSGGFNEFSVFDASYIRLREVSLGYSLPANLVKSLKLQGVDVSVSARNIWTYAPNLGHHIDPEVSNAPGALTRGLEFNSTPGVANYGVNLKVSF